MNTGIYGTKPVTFRDRLRDMKKHLRTSTKNGKVIIRTMLVEVNV